MPVQPPTHRALLPDPLVHLLAAVHSAFRQAFCTAAHGSSTTAPKTVDDKDNKPPGHIPNQFVKDHLATVLPEGNLSHSATTDSDSVGEICTAIMLYYHSAIMLCCASASYSTDFHLRCGKATGRRDPTASKGSPSS